MLLDRDAWDLCLDASGNMAVASDPYSQEQDVASECRVFAGECYYDTARGIDYFGSILGQSAPIQIMKEQLALAARRVPGVTNPTVFLSDISGRKISGQIQFAGSVVAL